MTRSQFIRILKLGIGLGLLAYAFKSGMFSSEQARLILQHPIVAVLNVFFLFLTALNMCLRWRVWTRALQLPPTLCRLFQMFMASHFVGTFLPSFGGDLAKIGMAIGDSPEKKARSTIAVIGERVSGAVVLSTVPGWALFFYPSSIPLLPVSLVTLVKIYSVVGTLLILISLMTDRFLPQSLRAFPHIALIHKALPGSVLFSVFNVSLNLFQHWMVASLLHLPMPLAILLVAVPIAGFASAVPFLPLGIGIGQIAYFKLFQILGGDGQAGATLVTALQTYTLVFNLLGVFWYFGLKFTPAEPASLPSQTEELGETG